MTPRLHATQCIEFSIKMALLSVLNSGFDFVDP